jgi:hypothetical protein
MNLKHAGQSLLALVIASVAQQACAAVPPAYAFVSCPTFGRVSASPTNAATGTDLVNLQAKIDARANAGGGTVVLSSGLYTFNAPIILRSGVSLCAPSGATLKWKGASVGYLLTTGPNNSGAANGASLLNLTFEGAAVFIKGDNVRIEANTFQNINRTALEVQNGADLFLRFGLWLSEVSRLNLTHNRFLNLEGGGIFGGDVFSNSVISNNAFNQTLEGIHVFCTSDTTYSNNTMTDVVRMGIELQIDALNPNDPNAQAHSVSRCSTLKNVIVQSNRMTDWRLVSYDNLITGISTEKLSGVVSNNVLTCGAGCDGLNPAKASFGIEVSGSGVFSVLNNTVTGFYGGIITNDGVTVDILNNAIYNADSAIVKANNASVTQRYRVENNQIENARYRGIHGAYYLTTGATMSNNLITRRAGAWAGDNARSGDQAFSAMVVGGTSPGTAPVNVSGNKVLFEGTAIQGFEARGIMLAGAPNGANISNNWIVWQGSSMETGYGSGIQINGTNDSAGVTLTGNTFQRLGLVSDGWECLFVASNNVRVNMAADVGSCSSNLTASYQVAVPTVQISPSTLTASVSGSKTVNWSATSSATPSSTNWYFGDGAVAANPANGTHTYSQPANRTVRAVMGFANKSVSIGKALVTQLVP